MKRMYKDKTELSDSYSIRFGITSEGVTDASRYIRLLTSKLRISLGSRILHTMALVSDETWTGQELAAELEPGYAASGQAVVRELRFLERKGFVAEVTV